MMLEAEAVAYFDESTYTMKSALNRLELGLLVLVFFIDRFHSPLMPSQQKSA